MTEQKITLQDIRDIISLVTTESKIEWFVFKQGDTEISISRNGVPNQTPVETNKAAPVIAPAAEPSQAAVAPQVAQQAEAPSAKPVKPAAEASEDDTLVKAPLVGTFYASPKPGEPPFVERGQKVSKGDTLCIVEVMKLMNSVKADVSGTVKEIMVADGEPVEFGQTLIIIEGSE